MTVQELITHLQAVKERDSDVFVWVDGNRMPVRSVDWLEHGVDVNASEDGISYYA
jgi:hypothetical protein